MIRPNGHRLRAPMIANIWLIFSYFPVIFTMYLTSRYFNAADGTVLGRVSTIDPFSLFLKSVALITVNYVVVISMRSKDCPERFPAVLRIHHVCDSRDRMRRLVHRTSSAIFLLTEFVSITTYILVGWLKNKPISTEAALKYFLMGSMSSAFMLFGFALMYGLSGTTNLYEMKVALHRSRRPTRDGAGHAPERAFLHGRNRIQAGDRPVSYISPGCVRGLANRGGHILIGDTEVATTAVFVRVFLLGLSTYVANCGFR